MKFPVAPPDTAPAPVSTFRATHLAACPVPSTGRAAFSIPSGAPSGKQASGGGVSGAGGLQSPGAHLPGGSHG